MHEDVREEALGGRVPLERLVPILCSLCRGGGGVAPEVGHTGGRRGFLVVSPEVYLRFPALVLPERHLRFCCVLLCTGGLLEVFLCCHTGGLRMYTRVFLCYR